MQSDTAAVIEAFDLTKRFGGPAEPPVLDAVNLRVEQGEVFGYIGPNGAGKTTTLRLFLGLLRPSSGSVRVFGEIPGERDELRARIGVLLENSGLDDRMTAFQSIDYHARLYGVGDRKRKIERLLDFVGLLDKRNERVGTFSTGMKRKLGLARSIIHDPELLLLDEPSAGLDPEAQKMVRELLQELASARRMTVFINSHHLDEVERLCSRIAILHRGRIRACDTVKSLQAGKRGHVRVRLSEPHHAVRAAALLEGWLGPDAISVQGPRIEVSLNGRTTPELVRLLVEDGLSVEEVSPALRRLEDVYFDIVGGEGGAA